jgi:hypothetical protein
LQPSDKPICTSCLVWRLGLVLAALALLAVWVIGIV